MSGNCGYCGRSFDELPRPNKPRTYCDKACMSAAFSKPRGPWKGRVCDVEGCGQVHYAKGLCNKHYLRLKNSGVLDDRRRPTLAEAVEAHVDKNGPIPTDRPELGACWLWLAFVEKTTGYGALGYGGKQYSAHRASYEAWKGPIPEGLQIDHLCRNRACVNPDHLEAVTNRVNTLRGENPMIRVRRSGACSRGHEFNAKNTRGYPDGRYHCRVCANEREKARQRRLKEARR